MVRIELPEGILERIMNRIHSEQRLLTIKRRLVIFSVSFIGSAIVFVPAFKLAYLSSIESGFLQFFSLIFSDFGIVAAYWQSFIMSLLESLPAMNLAIFLAIIFVFLESSRFLARDLEALLPSNPAPFFNRDAGTQKI